MILPLLIASWVSAATAVALGASLAHRPPRRLVRTNHVGRRVPATLGLAWLGGIVMAIPVAALAAEGPPRGGLLGAAGVGLVALVATGAGGLADDLVASGPRGIRGHLASLLSGRPTTGILKLGVGAAASITAAAVSGGGPARVAAAALTMAVATNVVNTLDVVPGRAIKWSVLGLLPALIAGHDTPHALLTAAGLGAALALLVSDLRERGMLGDAGSNPLGFLVGYGLAVQLPTWGLLVLAAGALVVQVMAETVTVSRLIEALPPLRWFDRAGRRDIARDPSSDGPALLP